MNEAHQRMATVGTDKELSDLLDFSAVRKKLEYLPLIWTSDFVCVYPYSLHQKSDLVRGYPFFFIPLRTDRMIVWKCCWWL